MSGFTHYVEVANELGSDEERLIYMSPGSAGDEDRIWLYVKGFDGGGVQLSPAEAIELGERLAALGREIISADGGASS